jgi:hypothetical protein
MIAVEKIDCTRFDEIKALLSKFPGRLSDTDWRRIFDYRWQRDETHCGLALMDDGRPVGFLGMIFSQRQIEGRTEKFCNLTAWVVEEAHRSRALTLILPVLRLKDYTVIDLTPSRRVYRMQRRLGFQDLDTHCRILLPFGRKLFQPRVGAIRIIRDPAVIEATLQGEHLRIFRDHRPYRCQHLVAATDTRYCYILYSPLKRKRIPYAHIQYISDPEFFARAYRPIRNAVLRTTRSLFIMIDSRFVENMKLPLSLAMPFRAPKQYRSQRLRPCQIDNLYSEVILLNLTTHPRLKYIIRNAIRRFLGKPPAITGEPP